MQEISSKLAATMKLPVVVLLALLGYCLCVPTTEISGVLGTVTVLESTVRECWLRVKVKSCSDVVWLELFGAQHYRSSRFVKPIDGEQHVCLPLPCDTDSRVTGKAVLTGDVMGKLTVTVKPDTFDATFDKLYSDEDQCTAGQNGDDAVATCEGAADVLSDLLIQEINVELEKVDEHHIVEHNSVTESQGGIQWQNKYDENLSVTCPDKQAFYRVKSEHRNTAEDRQWEWSCRSATQQQLQCSWSGYVNNFAQPILFHCPKNQVLAGVFSYHSNGKEDRRWRFRCCGAKNHYTKNCYLTNYINGWDRPMDFSVSTPQMFTGVYSHHDDHYGDRMWKIAVCDFSYCRQAV